MKRKGKIIRSSCFYVGLAALGAIVITGSLILNSYSPIISLYLNQETSRVEHLDKEEKIEDIYKSEFSSSRALIRDQKKYAETIQSEGSVLLINENYALPMRNANKITLFGTTSVDFIYGGAGAGSISTLGVPTLKEAFEDYDIDVNDEVWNLYSKGEGSSYRRNAQMNNYTVGEAPVSIFNDTIKSSFASYNDAAIVVIGRTGMEGGDLARTTTEDASKHSLELSQNEIDTIKLAKDSGFKKVIVLLNTLNAMQLDELESIGVDACLWIGAGGQFGINAIPKMIKGDLTPSGRLVDTYAKNALNAPAMKNYGDFTFTNVGDDTNFNKYVTYNEGIYVGYKYYETRYEDSVLKQGNSGSYKYTEEVEYPFGYGLSYSKFETTDYKMKELEDSFEFSVTIKNIGGVATKDVAQIYMQSPFTQYDKDNNIEKASVSLVGFAKTEVIEPNKEDTVTINVNKSELASYDYKKAKTYVVDEGDYYFAEGKNAHDALNNILASKGKTTSDGMDYNGSSSLALKYQVDSFDDQTYSMNKDNKITNQFDSVNLANYDSSIKYLSRSNWTDTFPKTYESSEGGKTNVAPQSIIDQLVVPTIVDESNKFEMPKTSTIDEKTGALSLLTLNKLPYDSEYWDILLNQMSPEDMYTLTRIGGYSTQAISSINKPGTIDKDGPAGISSTLVGGKGAFGYPVECVISSTWNVDIASRVGQLIGEDGYYTKTSGWYAPSMNIHRTQFSGRNFEYFSEDSFISGRFGAKIVEGCQSKGVYPYIKHFAFNDQETNRGGISTFMNEQTAREIYLKPFEMSIKEGNAHGVMAAMNRIGTTWVGHSKELMTNVLRNEWNFEGMVITDQASFYTSYIGDFRPTLAAGVDLMLCTKTDLWEIQNYQSSSMYMTYLRRASHNILYTIANSNAMNGQSTNTRIVNVIPTWKKWMISVDVILGVAIMTGLVFNTLSLVKALKVKKETN